MAKNNFRYKDISSNSRAASKKRKMRTRDKVILTLSILLIVFSAASIGVVAILNGRFWSGDDSVNSSALTPVAIKDKVVTFLVCGIDDEEGRGLGQRTDVMMIVNYDIEAGKVNVLQLPRDTFIGFEENSSGKLNAIYGTKDIGGIEGLSKKIYEAFTLNIDHYATIKMDGFKSLVDAVGGVTMDVPISFNLDGITIEKGVQTLTGDMAEKVVRERHSYATQDIGRLQTQRLFIGALLQKLLSMPKSQLVGLVPTLSQYITTDLSIAEMLGYVDLVSGFDLSNMTMYLLPGEGYKNPKNGTWYYTIHKDKLVELINEKFKPYSEKITAEDINCEELANNSTYLDDDHTQLGSGSKNDLSSSSALSRAS